MKDHVFIKKNIFTSVMFGAVFLFVLFESIFYNNNLSGIAFIISIPIFILSLIKVIIDILEDINDKITTYLKNMEHQSGYSYSLTWEDLTQIRSCSDCNQRASTDGFAEQNGRDAERADLTCSY